MCGIAGLYLREGQVRRERLLALEPKLHHRGPDGFNAEAHHGFGWLHTRLAIVGVTDGAQPLWNSDNSVGVIANGEIYNHIELRAELKGLGHRFLTHSDSEVLVHGWVEWGEGLLKKIHGMFAFALWEPKRERVLLVRDRLGIKPLLFSAGAFGVAFASELSALVELLPARPSIQVESVGQYLMSHFTSAGQTALVGVERLLPGEALWIEASQIKRRWRYWSVHDVRPTHWSFAEASECFDSLMAEVVREHLRSDVASGLFLSSGIDSSLLLALATQYTTDPPRALTVRFVSPSVPDESEVARTTAEHFGTQHTVLSCDVSTLSKSLPKVVRAVDELMGDPANLPVFVLAQTAAAQGLKVVWSGEGGDEIFAGYGRYRLRGPKRWIARWRSPETKGFRARGIFSSLPFERLFKPPLAQAMTEFRKPFLESWRNTPDDWSELQKMQALDIQTWLADDLLIKVDRMLMAHGVEGRVPWLDHRVVEFGLALPDALKCEGRQGKLFLRRWADRWVPKEILNADKKGFTVPLSAWLNAGWGNDLERALANSALIEQWGRLDALRAWVRGAEARGADVRPRWALLQLLIWESQYAKQ